MRCAALIVDVAVIDTPAAANTKLTAFHHGARLGAGHILLLGVGSVPTAPALGAGTGAAKAS
jgi:hypothetical protein